MDNSQWPQGIGVLKPVQKSGLEKKPRPQKEQALKCRRCASTNTKFCYYNNYSLSQPRYFCKTCRRYWTEGGSLRNVPVGGGSRKNKRPNNPSSSSSSSISTPCAPSKRVARHVSPPDFPPQNPKIRQEHDLNLAYNPAHHYNGMSGFVAFPFSPDTNTLDPNQHPSNPSSSATHYVRELLKNGSMSSRGLSSLMSVPVSDANSLYNSSSFPVSDFKPGLGFSLDRLGNGYGNLQGVEDHHHTSSSKTPFPFEELKPVSTGEFQQVRVQGESNQIDAGMGCWLDPLGARYTQ